MSNTVLHVSFDVGGLDAIAADVTHGVDTGGSSCTVTLTSLGGASIGDTLQVYAGFGGSTDILFNGEVVDIRYSMDGTVQLIGGDKFQRLKERWSKDERSYVTEGVEEATDNSTVQNLVEASGIDSGDTSIQGDDWEIGTIEPIVLGTGDVPLELINKIDEATPNFVTFARADGAIYRRPITIGSSSATYSQGVDILDGSRTVSKRGIVNSVHMTGRATFGVPIETTQQDDNSDIDDPPKYRTLDITNDIIQDDTHLISAAAGILARKNLRLDETTITVPGDGTIHPATTITIDADRLGLNDADRWVTTVRHSVTQSSFTTTITAITVGVIDI